MSPLGGQSLLRLLYIDGKVSKANGTVYYDNRAYQRPLYFDMDKWTYGPSDVIPALYSTSLLSPRKQQQAPMDTWGRPKIPQWPWNPAQDIKKAEETSREVNGSALEAGRDYYTSLIGINMQGLSFSDNSTQYEFDFESGYIDFNCFMITNQASLDDLKKMTYPIDGNWTGGNLWKDWSVYWETQKKEPSFNAVTVSPASLFDNPYLLYATQQVSEERNKHAVFNCTTATINLRTSLICTPQGCRPQRQRRIRALQMSEGDLDRRLTAFQNAVREWPQMTAVVTGSASATDNYIANDENAYGPQYAQNWTGVDDEMFSRRLTAAFNTVWEAGSDEYNLTKSSSALPENPADFWTNQTEATITTTEPAYYVNKLWAVILILTTIFLQVLAICGLVLKCLIRGPDILGFASSLTRDNAFVPVSGGSFQGGADRARSLRNMRVQLVDVQPGESHGYIALSAVPLVASAGEGKDGDKEASSGLGQLEKQRMYI
ncbi:hypothetical protein GCG54_00000638 [Colletotrichum gloeosporioides]|uniref:Uncharacterized protein n=1 Tax=Colletotrichum gloeosporioides TaxID=474922 RepID=A0A8H4FJA0_COLGL|nr:uncharacterized protein GCG54_00000638 [Colletotrichum gloeosporioides]KAF3804287.1 hypothetical protein GCG54_00000638 [Colletotrichum gloeosporioides]